MARYRTLSIQPPIRWCLLSPSTPWEAVKLAWYLWRHPDRVACLVGVPQKWHAENTSNDESQCDGELPAHDVLGGLGAAPSGAN